MSSSGSVRAVRVPTVSVVDGNCGERLFVEHIDNLVLWSWNTYKNSGMSQHRQSKHSLTELLGLSAMGSVVGGREKYACIWFLFSRALTIKPVHLHQSSFYNISMFLVFRFVVFSRGRGVCVEE